MCVCHRRFSSINIPSDLTEETCSIGTLSIQSSSGFDQVLKCVPHVQHDYFSSFNQSDHCFLASLLLLPSSLLKLRDTVSVPSSGQILTLPVSYYSFGRFILYLRLYNPDQGHRDKALTPCSISAYSRHSRRGTWGSPEHRITAKKINEHRMKSRRNTVTATIIFSYMILTSTLDVILLYLNSFTQNKI